MKTYAVIAIIVPHLIIITQVLGGFCFLFAGLLRYRNSIIMLLNKSHTIRGYPDKIKRRFGIDNDILFPALVIAFFLWLFYLLISFIYGAEYNALIVSKLTLLSLPVLPIIAFNLVKHFVYRFSSLTIKAIDFFLQFMERIFGSPNYEMIGLVFFVAANILSIVGWVGAFPTQHLPDTLGCEKMQPNLHH